MFEYVYLSIYITFIYTYMYIFVGTIRLQKILWMFKLIISNKAFGEEYYLEKYETRAMSFVLVHLKISSFVV